MTPLLLEDNHLNQGIMAKVFPGIEDTLNLGKLTSQAGYITAFQV